MFVPSSEIDFPQRTAAGFVHQHKIAVLDLGRKHAELRLDVRARVIVRDNKLTVGRPRFLREGIIAPKCKDKKIAVQTADEWAVISDLY